MDIVIEIHFETQIYYNSFFFFIRELLIYQFYFLLPETELLAISLHDFYHKIKRLTHYPVKIIKMTGKMRLLYFVIF